MAKLALKNWRPELIFLILAAFATRFWNVLYPNAVVFDEIYFKSFSAHYLDGHYFFDIHPPLGKLLIAGYAHLSGVSAAQMLNGAPVGLRLIPALAGALLVPLMWGILRRLGASRPLAFLGATLVLADNALLTESRLILIDSMLLFFGFSALYFYLRARSSHQPSRWAWLTAAALCAGAAVSTKWTGLGALAIILLAWLWDQRRRHASLLRRAGELAVLTAIPILIYVSVFWVHFSLLPLTGTEPYNGNPFMSYQFQQTLQGSPYYNPNVHMSFAAKFIELNKEMYVANQTLKATHPYSSPWYTWPLELRPIYYWAQENPGPASQGNIYLLGNPLVWWGVLAAIIAGVFLATSRGRRLRPATSYALVLAGTAYLINLLPFVGVTRVMFLYHYFFSFLFSIIFAVMLWNDLAGPPQTHLATPRRRYIYAAALALIFAGFLYFSSLSYGFPLSPGNLQNHMWLHSWR